jgi:hypothetical protein
MIRTFVRSSKFFVTHCGFIVVAAPSAWRLSTTPIRVPIPTSAHLLGLNAATFGGYGGYKFWSGIAEGYEDDGILGAANAIKPLYHIGRAFASAYLAYDRGDFYTLGKSATQGAGLTGVAVATIAAGGVAGVVAGQAGRFADLDAAAVVGDSLTPHHMPQAAQGFTSRADGGALVMEAGEHVMTRTYGAAGRVTAREEAGMSFRDVLARDMRNVRQIVGPKYDPGLRALLDYYYGSCPELMEK